METVTEPTREIPIRGHWDVIVIGGGLGGIAAAIAAARTGVKTLLVERNTCVGGVATAGMCCSIFNGYYTSEHKPGSLGIPMEIADNLAEAMGYGEKWHEHKGHIIYDLELGKLVLQEMLEKSGVELLFGGVFAGAVVENDILKGVIIESKSGREALLAKNVVDATGDADVAFQAGAPVHIPNEARGDCGKHSLVFRLSGVDVDKFIDYFRNNPDEYPEMIDVEWTVKEALEQYDECGTFLFPHHGGSLMKAIQKAIASGKLPATVGIFNTTNACQMHGMRQTGTVHIVTGYVSFDGLDISRQSAAIADGRRLAYIISRAFKEFMPGFEHSYVAGVASNLGVRISRYIKGDFVFTAEMMEPGTKFEDCVGKIVSVKGAILNKRIKSKHGSVGIMGPDTFDLPYRCLLPQKIDGLIMGAGRSLSVSDPSILRIMVHTMTVGQAAGAAAAVSVLEGQTLKKTSIAGIQQALKKIIVDSKK